MRGRRRSLRSLVNSEGGVTVIGLVTLLGTGLIADALTGGRLGREYVAECTTAYADAYGSLGTAGWIVVNVAVLAVFAAQILLMTKLGGRLRAGLNSGLDEAVIRLASMPLPARVRARFAEEWRDALADLRDRDAPWHRRVAELVDIAVHVPALVVVLRGRATADER